MSIDDVEFLRFGEFVLQKRSGARARRCCWIRTEESKRKRQKGARFPGRQIPCIFSVTEIASAKGLTTVEQLVGGLIPSLDGATGRAFIYPIQSVSVILRCCGLR